MSETGERPEFSENKGIFPVGNNKDRYGNIGVVVESEIEQEVIGKKILVSNYGQEVFVRNPNILNAICEGLNKLAPTGEELPNAEAVVGFESGEKMTFLSSGVQSHAFLFETENGEKYVIKTKRHRNASQKELWQPYVNEMLQVAELNERFRKNLEKNKVAFSQFIFASEAVSCVVFEEGTRTQSDTDLMAVSNIALEVKRYTDKERTRGNKLWHNVFLDASVTKGPYGDKQVKVLPGDVIKRDSDNVCVWIDPFMHGLNMDIEDSDANGPWYKKIFKGSGKRYDYNG